MSERTRILLLSVAILVIVSVVAATLAIGVLYRATFEQQRDRLARMVMHRARILKTVAGFDAELHEEGIRGVAGPTEVGELVEVYRHFATFGDTGEFTLARRAGDQIVWLLRSGQADAGQLSPTSFDSEVGQPMQRALSGESGTMVGLDYRGTRVLAAYATGSGNRLGRRCQDRHRGDQGALRTCWRASRRHRAHPDRRRCRVESPSHLAAGPAHRGACRGTHRRALGGQSELEEGDHRAAADGGGTPPHVEGVHGSDGPHVDPGPFGANHRHQRGGGTNLRLEPGRVARTAHRQDRSPRAPPATARARGALHARGEGPERGKLATGQVGRSDSGAVDPFIVDRRGGKERRDRHDRQGSHRAEAPGGAAAGCGRRSDDGRGAGTEEAGR